MESLLVIEMKIKAHKKETRQKTSHYFTSPFLILFIFCIEDFQCPLFSVQKTDHQLILEPVSSFRINNVRFKNVECLQLVIPYICRYSTLMHSLTVALLDIRVQGMLREQEHRTWNIHVLRMHVCAKGKNSSLLPYWTIPL